MSNILRQRYTQRYGVLWLQKRKVVLEVNMTGFEGAHEVVVTVDGKWRPFLETEKTYRRASERFTQLESLLDEILRREDGNRWFR